MVTIMGVDPGFSGGLAFLDAEAHQVDAYKMPVERRSNGKTYLLGAEVGRLIKKHGPIEAWIEDVYSSPQMGVTSAFSFGEGKGVLVGVCSALDVPIRLVSPATWKRSMRLTADKSQAKAMARAIFPLTKLSTEGKCEAVLIAVYGSLCAK